jgi:flagellar hook-associated protein 2
MSSASPLQNVSGLVSGLDTNTLVTQLLSIEARPQVRIQQKQAVEEVRQTALRDVQMRLTNLQSAVTGLRDVATWGDSQSVDSSDSTKVVATRTAGAAAGAFALTITDLARADQYKSATLASIASGGTLTVGVGAASIDVTVAAGASLATVASAINGSSGTPVYASVVNSQLVLSSRTTGAANTVAISGTGALTTELGFTRSITSSDAHYNLDGVAKTSSSNVVTDALPGIQFVLKAAAASAVTISVGAPTPNTVTIQSKIQGFVDQYNSTIDFIRDKLTEKKVASPQNASDRAKGVLSGDAALTGLLTSMRGAVSSLFSGRPDATKTLAQVGLSTGTASGTAAVSQDSIAGKLTLDTAKLSAKLTESLSDVKALFTNVSSTYSEKGLAQRLDDLLTSQVGSAGAFTSRLSSGDATIARAKKDSAAWDLRLASKEKALRAQYTRMETALSGAQSQGQWLAGQISRL